MDGLSGRNQGPTEPKSCGCQERSLGEGAPPVATSQKQVCRGPFFTKAAAIAHRWRSEGVVLLWTQSYVPRVNTLRAVLRALDIEAAGYQQYLDYMEAAGKVTAFCPIGKHSWSTEKFQLNRAERR